MKRKLNKQMREFLERRIGVDLVTSAYEFRTHFRLTEEEAYLLIKEWIRS